METSRASSEFPAMKSVNSFLLAVSLMSVFLIGCQGTLPTSIQPTLAGQTIQRSSQISLDSSGESSGYFHDGYVKVSYRYAPAGDGLNMSGAVWFEDAVLMNYLFVNTFHLDVLLADAQGRILSQQSLATAVNMSVADSIDFITSVPLPPQATCMAFTYNGQVHGVGESPTSIWSYPVLR